MDIALPKKPKTTVALIVLMAGAVLFALHWKESKKIYFATDAFDGMARAVGTPPRAEREFKIGITGDTSRFLLDDEFISLQRAIHQGLENALVSTNWSAPNLTGQPYFVERDPMMAVFRDLYFDTDDFSLCRNGDIYRLRHRFITPKQLAMHETRPTERDYFPYRGEIQAKTGRVEMADGFSVSNESRLEFRLGSSGFSPANPPPPRPWYPKDYLSVVQSGLFKGLPTYPGSALAASIKESGYRGAVHLRPSAALISTRLRMHLNMVTEFGSGPNPNQAFIITIDRFDLSNGLEYLAFLKRGWYEGNNAARPPVWGTKFEIEIEFERNVSTKLDSAIEAGGSSRLAAIRSAFLADQIKIRGIILDILHEMGLSGRAVSKSKYRQACAHLAKISGK